MLRRPNKGYFKRMMAYLSELFPLHERIIMASLLYISFSILFLKTHNHTIALISWRSGLGITSIFLMMLILRLMDELKDKEIDARLFKHRPLPSGRVLEFDIIFSLNVAITLFLGLNITNLKMLGVTCIALVYSFLMFKYFFIPDIHRKSLLLTLMTHLPISPLMLCYVLVTLDLDFSSSGMVFILYTGLSLLWEISRKIRSAEEEDQYETYSQIFGRIPAIGIILMLMTSCLAIEIYFYQHLHFKWVYLALIIGAYAYTGMKYIQFIVIPNSKTSKLKSPTELFIGASLLAILFL